MPGWSSSDLLIRFNRLAGRPPADAITDTLKYLNLSDAQDQVVTEIASLAPKALFNAPTQMATADGGLTFTFGTDGNSYPIVPIAARIYPNLLAVPSYPWNPGADYLDEGATIRMPNNNPYTGAVPYWQGIVPPTQISATVQPVLQPPAARILICIRAVQFFAEEAIKNGALADQMQIRWDREFPKQMTVLRKHFCGRSYGSTGRIQWYPLAGTR